MRFALAALGLAGFIAAVHFRVVFLGETFVLRDALRFILPSREAFAAAVADGRIPEWWDGVGFGVAYAANPFHGVASPLFWPFAAWGSAWAFDLLTLLQLLILALGTAAMAHRLGASFLGAWSSGAILAASGYVVSAIPNGAIPYLSWIPWVGWAAMGCLAPRESPGARTRAAIFFAFAFALHLLSGEPGHVFIAALVVLVLILTGERPLAALRRLLIPVAAGIGLAAAGLVPAFLLLRESARAARIADGPLKWSMHPGRLLELIWPLPFGSEGSESWFAGAVLGLPPGDPFFAFSLFVGGPVLLLAIAAVHDGRVRKLFLASFVFLLLAFGSFTPIYRFAGSLFPPLRLVNFPEKFFFGALLLWTVAAGVGFTSVFEGRRPVRWIQRSSAVLTALLALVAIAVHLLRGPLSVRLGRVAPGVAIERGLDVAAMAAALAAAGAALFLAALLLARRGAGTPLVAAFALGGTVAPLLFAGKAVTPLAPRALVARGPSVLEALPRPPLAQPDVRPRLFHYPAPHARPPLPTGPEIARDLHETLDTNVAARFGYGVIPGFETGDSARFRRFWEETSPRMSFPAFVRLLGVDFALVPDPDRFAPGFPVLARFPGWGVVGTFPVRPRAFVAPRATVVASADDGLGSLAWPERENDPARVVVSGQGAETLDTRGPLQPCRMTSPRPEEVTLDCQSSSGGYAVILDENLPGWTAELDGRPASILTADGLFRAVRVDPGPRRVVFRYRTSGLRPGGVISLLTCLALALALFVRSRPGRTPSSRLA